MARICYCSKVRPGKYDTIKSYFANNPASKGFDCWLQRTPQGDFLIQSFERTIFNDFRESIQRQNPDALQWNTFYIEVLGIDYSSRDCEPQPECLLDLIVSPTPASYEKRSFILPLLPHKETAHRESRRLAMGEKKALHIASLEPFGVYRLTCWLQTTPYGKYIVAYSERKAFIGTAVERIIRGRNSAAWQEISAELMDQTGLSMQELSPDVLWLTP